jgi:hypothetical protein
MRPIAVSILLLTPSTLKPLPPELATVGTYLPEYPVTSAFLSTHGTRPHVKVMLVWEVEVTWRSAGGEEGATCREINMSLYTATRRAGVRSGLPAMEVVVVV